MTPIDRIRADRVGPPLLPVQSQTPAPVRESKGRTPFAEHLKRACLDAGVKVEFSGHAALRAESRSIDLNQQQLSRIDMALEAVSTKGAKRALVMLDDLALIVGVEKRTVITLVDGNNLRNNVFTAIDAAVIA